MKLRVELLDVMFELRLPAWVDVRELSVPVIFVRPLALFWSAKALIAVIIASDAVRVPRLIVNASSAENWTVASRISSVPLVIVTVTGPSATSVIFLRSAAIFAGVASASPVFTVIPDKVIGAEAVWSKTLV